MKKTNVLDRLAFKWLVRNEKRETKFSETRTISTMKQLGEAISSPQNYETYSRKGYQKNAMVYVCVNKIATAVGGVEWCLYSKKKGANGKRTEILDHPLLDLLKKPNPLQDQTGFMESWIGYYLLSGNTYIEANRPFPSKPPTELWPVRSDRVKIVGGKNGYPAAYRYDDAGGKKDFPVDVINMGCDMLHVKTFNPVDQWYGQSYLQAGASAMDQNNEANQWNLAMLQNSASPSGIFTIQVTGANPKGELSQEKYDRLKAEIDDSYSGSRNAGRPMLGEGGLTWQQMSLSPKDMDFLNNRNVSSEDIARIFGVPAELVGLGQKTFSNYKEANLAFNLQTVIPHLKKIQSSLNRWLTPIFGDDLCLEPNYDDIDAIQQYRVDQLAALQPVSFLTQNEKRARVKYDDKEGWDVFVIGNQAVATPDELTGGGSFNEPQDDVTVPEEESGKTPPIKKPKPDDSDETDEESGKGFSFANFKTFNPVNENERQRSRKQQNARKSRLERAYYTDLREDFSTLAEIYFDVAEKVRTPETLEYALIKASQDFMPVIAKTIRKHDRIIMEEFGFVVINEGKSTFPGQFETKANLKYDDYVRSFVARRSGEAVKEIQGTNQKQIHRVVKRITETALTNGETNVDYAKELLSEFEGLSAGRARLIARTETSVASNSATREAVKSLQLPNMEKGWVAAIFGAGHRDGGESGDLPNHQIMNGQWVDLDEKFTVPPDADMDGPGDESADASQLCNCGCVLVYRSRNKT